MPPHSKYTTPDFFEFYASFRFPDEKSKHTADIALSYYIYARYQYFAYTETYDEFFKIENPNHSQVMEYLRKSWSFAFGMYGQLRTTIEALSRMRKMLGDNQPIDKYFEENISRLVNIMNDVVKHPMYKHSEPSEACEPQALSMNGEIDIITWSDKGESARETLYPGKDFMVIHDYLEYLAKKFLGR